MRWVCLATFHFAFQSQGSLPVSAHSGSPHHQGYNFSAFSFVRISEKVHLNFCSLNILLQIHLLGDVGEKVHAARKYGWKVQSGRWNCLWQLWYFPQFVHFWNLGFGSLFLFLVELFCWFRRWWWFTCFQFSLQDWNIPGELMTKTLGFCHFGDLCEFWDFFRWCSGSFWEQGSLWEALSWMLPL